MKTRIALACGTIAALALFEAAPALAEPAYATRNVNIRSGPGLNFEVVDQLVEKEPVDKGNCNTDGTWCYVRHEGTNGWVAAVFLSATPPGQQTPPTQTPPTTQPPSSGSSSGDPTAYKARSIVNVRTGPGTTFTAVDRLEANERVTLGQCNADGTWCYITHDGADGWVAASYLMPVYPPATTPTPPTTTPTTPADNGVRIATSTVNVRTGPGTNYSVVDRLDGGEKVELAQCSSDGAWCYVSHDGPDGWVAADFLRRPATTTPPTNHGSGNNGSGNNGNYHPGTPPTHTVTEKVGTAIAGMPVRSAPTLFTTTVGRLERNQTIKVEECSTDGYWCHVVSDDLDGWVPAAFLQITETEVAVPSTNMAEAARNTPIRKTPGAQAQILGMLPAGSEVSVSQCGPAGNWCQITHEDVTGWVAASALKAPEDAPPPPANQSQQPDSVCFTGFGGLQICLGN